MNEDVRALQDALENLNHAQKTMCIKNDFNRYLFLSRHLENSDFKPDELCITSWLPFFYLCHFELPLGIILNRRELWGRFGWLKTRVSGFLIILRNTTNDDSVILNSGFYFYGITLKAHYSITLKILRFQVIGFCFLWISIALFLVQSPVARGFELHGYWVLCESRCRQNSLSHEDE